MYESGAFAGEEEEEARMMVCPEGAGRSLQFERWSCGSVRLYTYILARTYALETI